MKLKKIGSLTIGLCLFNPQMVRADHDSDDREARFGIARVIRVQPVIRTVDIDEPQNECWNEEVRRYEPSRRVNETGATLFGGMLGGLIGSQFGHGRGRIGPTIAGSVIGGVIGGTAAHHSNRDSGGYEEVDHVRRCRVVSRVRTEERVDGYWVDYEYRGEVYRTHLSYRPGDQIRVRITIEPVAP